MGTRRQFRARDHHIFIITLCILPAAICSAQPPRVSPSNLLKPKTLEEPSFAGEARARVTPSVVTTGGTVRVELLFECTAGSHSIFNPFLSSNFALPHKLVITSKDGRVRYEILCSQTSALPEEAATAWIQLRQGEATGRELLISTGAATGKRPGSEGTQRRRAIDLPVGEYDVHAVYSSWLIAIRPQRSDVRVPEPIPGISVSEMHEPLVISKPAELFVISSKGAGFSETQIPACPLRIDLHPTKLRLLPGARNDLQITLSNQSTMPVEMYNPLLDPLLRQRPVTLAVLAPDGTYIGDWLAAREGSSRLPEKTDWVRVPPGGIVSKIFHMWAPMVRPAEFAPRERLPPGQYFLELWIRSPFLSGMPAAIAHTANGIETANHPEYRKWVASFPGRELCRSNRVSLEVLP